MNAGAIGEYQTPSASLNLDTCSSAARGAIGRGIVRLWYQGPSYTVFRKCLHYPPEIQWKGIDDIINSIVFSVTRMEFRFPDGERVTVNNIRWTWFPEGHTWEWKFPFLSE